MPCRTLMAANGHLLLTSGVSIQQAAQWAVETNPQVLSAKAQYQAALHEIQQAYAPQDPELSWTSAGSPNGLNDPAVKSLGVSESFQFPGKSLLQGDQVHRNAEIAKLTYLAAARDARAQAQTLYYQTLLDQAAVTIAAENAVNVSQLLEVAKVAYTANQVTEADLTSAQFTLSVASQTVATNRVAEENDEASLNAAMGRRPQAALFLTSSLTLTELNVDLETIRERALVAHQELLEATLTEKNNQTALRLAWMSLLPDFNLAYSHNTYYTLESEPHAERPQDNTGSFAINVPVFFWFKQKEDIRAAARLLEAARRNRLSVELQTETNVVQLYRTTTVAYKTAVLYRDGLIPLAEKNLRVALVAYQSKKVDFTTLSMALQTLYNARSTYLTSTNQYLAGRISLEQWMGVSL